VFAYEFFKLFCPYLLLFTIEKNSIVVTNNFIDGFPEILDHFAYVISLTSDFDLLVF